MFLKFITVSLARGEQNKGVGLQPAAQLDPENLQAQQIWWLRGMYQFLKKKLK